MSDVDKPLAAALTQGWEVAHYSAAYDQTSGMQHCFLLRRQNKTKLLIVRKKMVGEGVVAEELEV